MTNTVLTVDDSKAIRDMVSFTLTAAGYEVIEAVNGGHGLRILTPEIALVVLDVRMEPIDGFEYLLFPFSDDLFCRHGCKDGLRTTN